MTRPQQDQDVSRMRSRGFLWKYICGVTYAPKSVGIVGEKVSQEWVSEGSSGPGEVTDEILIGVCWKLLIKLEFGAR